MFQVKKEADEKDKKLITRSEIFVRYQTRRLGTYVISYHQDLPSQVNRYLLALTMSL